MGNSSQKKEQEKLFDELIEIKFLYKTKEKICKETSKESMEFSKMKEELSVLKKRIKNIETSISGFGESFFDVYDSELVKPLSETDILILRDEIKEVRNSLETMGNR